MEVYPFLAKFFSENDWRVFLTQNRLKINRFFNGNIIFWYSGFTFFQFFFCQNQLFV